MFFKKRRQRKQAEGLFKLLHHAWEEVTPRRFVTQDDAELFLLPKLATLNSFCGSASEDQFATVSLERIYEAVVRYEKSGLADQVMGLLVTSKDVVVGALVSACRREYDLREKQNVPGTSLDMQLIETAEKIVLCLNRVATHHLRRGPTQG